VEARVRLDAAGATLVRPGQRASLVSHADVAHPVRLEVAGIAAAASDAVEARLRLPAGPAWRPGVTGEARITVRRSSLLGALWWALRRRVRSDVLL
jgi:hypothetical protein